LTPLTPSPSIDDYRGNQTYLGVDHVRNERRTWIVAGISLLTMALELVGGLAFHSIALVANGLHMAAHVASLTVAAIAYRLARAYANDPRFAFGAGKVGYLAGFANGVILGVTALVISAESLGLLLTPQKVDYPGAIGFGVIALGINLVCLALLRPKTRHLHDRDGDLNLSAAHLHLASDAMISSLALGSLVAGRYLNWTWADPLAALAGAGLIAHFAWQILSRAGRVLLDINPSAQLTSEIRGRIEGRGGRILDLHLWRIGPGHHAAIVVLSASEPLPTSDYHACLSGLKELSHVTIEVTSPSPS